MNMRDVVTMNNQLSRTELIFGKDAMRKLANAGIAIFGIGGVGGYVVEALARSGIGTMDLFDDDVIHVTNLNRQIHATRKNIGEYKVDAAKERILEINPDAVVNVHKLFYTKETSQQVDLGKYDYIVDAIDTVSGKIELVVKADESKVSIISSMGAGNKIETTSFEVADIYDTSVCPLARVMRKELRKRGIPKLKVVYSKEVAIPPKKRNLDECKTDCVSPIGTDRNGEGRRQVPGSNAFVPPVVGMIIASEIVKDLTGLAGVIHN